MSDDAISELEKKLIASGIAPAEAARLARQKGSVEATQTISETVKQRGPALPFSGNTSAPPVEREVSDDDVVGGGTIVATADQARPAIPFGGHGASPWGQRDGAPEAPAPLVPPPAPPAAPPPASPIRTPASTGPAPAPARPARLDGADETSSSDKAPPNETVEPETAEEVPSAAPSPPTPPEPPRMEMPAGMAALVEAAKSRMSRDADAAEVDPSQLARLLGKLARSPASKAESLAPKMIGPGSKLRPEDVRRIHTVVAFFLHALTEGDEAARKVIERVAGTVEGG